MGFCLDSSQLLLFFLLFSLSFYILSLSMGPIRALMKRKKKKAEKKVDQNALVSVSSGSQLRPLDWWDDFSLRITGKKTKTKKKKHKLVFFCLAFSFVWFVE